MKLLTESQLFPPLKAFQLALECNHWMVEAHENYNKGSYRNKYEVLGANGPILLTVPLVKGKHRNQLISEVLISHTENWQSQHLRTLQSCYGKSPYFEEYYPALQSILETRFDRLLNLNKKALEVICELLGFPIPVSITSDYIFPGDIDANSIKDYRDALKVNGDWKKNAYKQYPQIFMEKQGFVPHLSILDLLFCKGPEAVLYLKSDFTL
nr:WbqC family protein [Saprospiraceae bacterium]